MSGINEELLSSTGASWDQPQRFEPGAIPEAALRLFEERSRAIINNMEPFRPWVLKDPRFSLVFPQWRPLLEKPLAVLVYRNPFDVAKSLAERDGLPVEWSTALWTQYTSSALDATEGLPRLPICYDSLIAQPEGAARRLLAGLVARGATTLRWPVDNAPVKFVKTGLRHHHACARDTLGILDRRQQELFARLVDCDLHERSATEGRRRPAES